MLRVQRRREKGWRAPPGAIYVGRPSPWGNPWPIDGDMQPWLALALGQRGDRAGRRASAVIAYRAWMLGQPLPVPSTSDEGGELEYTNGQVRKVKDIVVGMGLLMLGKAPIAVPPVPDIEPLRHATALACWCALCDEHAEGKPAGVECARCAPCHADVLVDLVTVLVNLTSKVLPKPVDSLT